MVLNNYIFSLHFLKTINLINIFECFIRIVFNFYTQYFHFQKKESHRTYLFFQSCFFCMKLRLLAYALKFFRRKLHSLFMSGIDICKGSFLLKWVKGRASFQVFHITLFYYLLLVCISIANECKYNLIKLKSGLESEYQCRF